MLYAVYIRQKKELKVCLLGLGVGKQTDLSNVYTSFCTLNKLAISMSCTCVTNCSTYRGNAM